MVAIILMGNAGSAKGKGKEGQTSMTVVKLGRYAVLVQLLKSLDKLDSAAKIENRLKSFAEQLESRLAVMLEAEVSTFASEDTYTDLIGEGSETDRRLSGSDLYLVLSPSRHLEIYQKVSHLARLVSHC
jgi:hypothetical protein